MPVYNITTTLNEFNVQNIAVKVYPRASIKRYNILLSFFITFLMLALPVWLFYNKLTLSTHFEESVGFRYFHSLRILYGAENPWLPQGQLPGILHIAIQKSLTFAGHPVNEFFPRVDLFSIWAVTLPLLLAGISYYWATKPLRTYFTSTIFAVVFLACFFSPRFQDGWMLLPDYHIWMISLAMVAIGWVIRLMSQTDQNFTINTRVALLLGLYAGACLSVKVTLFTYPLSIGLLLLSLDVKFKEMIKFSTKSKSSASAVWPVISKKIFIFTLVSGSTALLTWSTVLLIYYQGNASIIPEHFVNLFKFTDSQVQLIRSNNLMFLKTFTPITLLDFFSLIPIVLLGCFLSIRKHKYSSIAMVILPAGLIELYMLYQRNYTHTNIEVQYLFYILGTILVTSLFQKNSAVNPFYKNIINKFKNQTKLARYACILAIFITPIYIHTNYTLTHMKIFTAWIKELDIAGKGLQKAMAANQGNTLFLIPISESVDEYNLRTIDNGLFKSATGLSPLWDRTSFVARLYSDRWFASNYQTLPNVENYQNIVFRTAPKENIIDALKRLRRHYLYTFNTYNCEQPYFMFKVKELDVDLVFCTKNNS